jgi:hypothetical protein
MSENIANAPESSRTIPIIVALIEQTPLPGVIGHLQLKPGQPHRGGEQLYFTNATR